MIMPFNNTFLKGFKAEIASLHIMQPHTEKNNAMLKCSAGKTVKGQLLGSKPKLFQCQNVLCISGCDICLRKSSSYNSFLCQCIGYREYLMQQRKAGNYLFSNLCLHSTVIPCFISEVLYLLYLHSSIRAL